MIEGYRAYLEDIANPGFTLVYNQLKTSTATSLSLSVPTIKPSTYYRIKIQAKNCALFSSGAFITLASATVPSQPDLPKVDSYVSATDLLISWSRPKSDGGFAITSYRLYVDNALLVELNPSLNFYQLGSLVKGTTYKL